MTPRREVVELLVSFDPATSCPLRGHFVHGDGRPFTSAEAALATSPSGDDVREVNRLTADWPDHDKRMNSANSRRARSFTCASYLHP